jgi:NADH dehydrogenase/NADH:ubiquinone oxidoreductase subunit G
MIEGRWQRRCCGLRRGDGQEQDRVQVGIMQAAALSSASGGLRLRGGAAPVVWRRALGALTSKPYAFVARPWELRRTDTVDTMDAMGASIQVHSKGGEVVRVQVRENDEINEEWIHDKTRWAYDGLKRQRLTRPLVRGAQGGWDETHSSWRGAFQTVGAAVQASKANNGGKASVRAVVGALTDLYAVTALSDWVASVGGGAVESLGSRGGVLDADVPSRFRFNSSIVRLEEADFVLLVGTNLVAEAPLLQLRLRKMFIAATTEIVNVGMPLNLTFPVAQAGLTARTLVEIAEGRHAVCARLAMAKKPAILVGSQVFSRADGDALAAAVESIAAHAPNVRQFAPDGSLAWDGVNVVHSSANDCGHLELGRTVPFDAKREAKPDVLYLMGVSAKELPVALDRLAGPKTFVVVQGHHGDELASKADVVLPGGAYTEQNGIYINFEGRPQKARNAVTPPADAREDWKILRALSETAGGPVLPYDSEAALAERIAALLPTLAHRSKVPACTHAEALLGPHANRLTELLGKGVVDCTPFRPKIYDFYLDGNPIAGTSVYMAKASRDLTETSNFLSFDSTS